MFEYETIRFIWWLLIGVVMIAFAITDGFDFGVGALLPFLGRKDLERRVIINTVGSTWEGNQVWLVLLGGAIFAVWPSVYATLFSGLYVAMMLLLFSLFLRPAGFDYRSKIEHPRWRSVWDWCLFLGGVIPPLLFGVLVGNLIRGLPFHLDADLRPIYDGSFWELLAPFPLLCGFIGVLLTTVHGGIFLSWRTEGLLRDRSVSAVKILAPVLILAIVIGGYWVLSGYDRPEIAQFKGTSAASNPMNKTIAEQNVAWTLNFVHYPLLWLAPIMALLGMSLAWMTVGRGQQGGGIAFLFSSVGIFGLLLTVGFALFPFLLISTRDPRSSLTVWDATSSHSVLLIAFWITVLFLPIVLAYTRWVYKVMWGAVNEKAILDDPHTLY